MSRKRGLTVADLPYSEDWQWVTDETEIRAILEYIGQGDEDYGALLVKVGDGDYDGIYAIEGTIPYTWKMAWKLV